MIKLSGMSIKDFFTVLKNETLMITTRTFHREKSVRFFLNYNQFNNINMSGCGELRDTNTLVTKQMIVTTSVAQSIR